ncbi:MAG: RecQ family ATP-dependent DNA helicase [Puniceicoccaceae bacterium]
MPASPEQALKRHFQLDRFRSPQREIIQSILDGKPTLVIMPTGGGKSLCYQLPAMLLPGVTLVISPLIALMKDQVDALQQRGIPAAMINSSQSWPEQRSILESLKRKELKLLYVAPERFRAQSFVDALTSVEISLFAVDEAHCISQWGHDFRPDYMRMGEALSRIGNPLCAAFTATATPDVQNDICRNLHLKAPQRFVSGFARSNLTFNIRQCKGKSDKYRRIRSLIETHQNAIIYCATRKSVEEVAEWLNDDGIEHVTYHGGLSDADRTEAQERFIQKQCHIAVATNAFGMGIDRDDIRLVCHYEMPGSVEAYYQEAGRAGRDGKPGHCELLFNYADKRVQEFFVEGANPPPSLIQNVYAHLFAKADAKHEVALPIEELTQLLGKGINGMAVSSALSNLRRLGRIERFDIPGSRVRGSRIVDPNLTPDRLELDIRALDEKRKRDEQKLKQVLQWVYAQNCRQQWILRYFGELKSPACGKCDACQNAASYEPRPLTDEQLIVLKKALSGVARMSSRVRAHQWQARYGRDRIIKCLLGSKGKTIVDAGLNQLTTWGALADYAPSFVSELFDHMAREGLVEVTDGDYPLLQLTEYGSRVMFGEILPEMAWPGNQLSPNSSDAIVQESPENMDEALYQALVKKRNELARVRNNAPSYTIFPNTVLKKLASTKPLSESEALQIKGIGPAKAKTVLPTFLRIIANHEAAKGSFRLA